MKGGLMKKEKIIDDLTYRSWLYQIYWYKMDRFKARKLFKDWKIYEKRHKREKGKGSLGTLPEA